MLTVVTRLFALRLKETSREQALSNQVDRLEFELAKVRREKEAVQIRLDQERAEFERHRLRDYPAAGSWVGELHNRMIFDSDFQNPVEYVLTDVEELGYDVSAAWMVHRATLDLVRRYQVGVVEILNTAGYLYENRTVLRRSSQ